MVVGAGPYDCARDCGAGVGIISRGCWIGSYHAGGSLGCCVAAFVARDEWRVGFTLACADILVWELRECRALCHRSPWLSV